MEEKIVKIVAGFNLLNPTKKPLTLVEKIYTWALSIGKYIIISTEIIVLVAFAARFKLDYDISDLTDNIEKKAQQIASLSTQEARYREIMSKIESYRNLSDKSYTVSNELRHINSLKPKDININMFSFSSDAITIQGNTESLQSLRQFEELLKRETAVYHSQYPKEVAPIRYENVVVEKVEMGSQNEKNKFSLKILVLENVQR